MIDEQQVAITDSEWDLMRAVWTLKRVTSRQLIEIMETEREWAPSTTKTMLRRLIKKNAISQVGDTRPFDYVPAVREQQSMDAAAVRLFDSMCAMRTGSAVAAVIQSRELSQDDIANLQQILAEKMKTAPKTVACNCLPDGNCMNMNEGDEHIGQ